MRRLNEWSVARLAANPEGFRRFFARNLAQRAVRQSHGFKPQYEFIALLQQHRVEFCLIGGHAVQAHGFGRETEDIDIVWRRSDENDAHLVAVLKQANASWISSEKDPATGIERLVPVDDGYVRINHLMMLWTDYGFVDPAGALLLSGMAEEDEVGGRSAQRQDRPGEAAIAGNADPERCAARRPVA